MREIKFRAWYKNQMVDLKKITPFALNPDLPIEGLFIPFSDEFILMQFTGLLDKNGKEIYEGDIVTCHTIKTKKPSKGVVKYFKGWYGIETDDYVSIASDSFKVTSINANEDFEIIGNKFENPELLNA